MKFNKLIAVPAIALTAGINLAACGGSAAPTSQTVQQWWGSTGQARFQRIDRVLGQITSDSQYDPASLPSDGDTLVSDAQNALGGTPPPVDSKDYNAWLNDVVSFGQLQQSGNGNGLLTGQQESKATDAKNHVTAFYNVLACHGVSGTGTCQSSGASNSDSSAPDPNQSTYAPATEAAPTDTPSPPAPAPTVYVPVQAPVGPAAQSDAWSTAVAYTNDVNAGDNASAWNMLSSSVQSHGWGGSYNTYVADFTPLSFDNVTYSSSSGDSVTFTFMLHNHSTGSESFTTCTFTVDNGVITSST